MSPLTKVFLVSVVVLIAGVLLLFINRNAESAEPKDAWLDLITQVAGNPSREAAQTEQESSWDIFAESPFAKGLRQFTDETADWLSAGLCRDLGPYDPWDARWQLECGIRYVEKLQADNAYGGYCNNRHVAEQEYNGGAWVVWELRTAESVSLQDARAVCGQRLDNGRKRSNRSCAENYSYPTHIDRRQSRYAMQLSGMVCR